MEIFFLMLLGAIIYSIYLIIEFSIPIVLFYLTLTHSPTWVWATLLIIWFIARMTIYIIKETKKNE